MRAFLLACLAIVVIGAGGYFFLSDMQQPSGVAYSTEGARIDTSWAWRSVSGPTGASEGAQAKECDPRKTWQWIFVDFGRPDGEPALCSISQ
jgi:hypothetical protein